MNDPIGAVQEAETMAALPVASASDLYNAACLHAIASVQTGQDTERAASWQAQAVSLLRRARAAGFEDTDSVKSDTDLDSFRERDDFQQLLREWDIGAAPPPPASDAPPSAPSPPHPKTARRPSKCHN